MDYSIMEQYWIWLSAVPGMTLKRFYALLTEFSDARTVWDNVDACKPFLDHNQFTALRDAKSSANFYTVFEELRRQNVTAVTRLSDNYPKRLTNIIDPPPTLYVRGDMRLNDPMPFAIVGSRSTSQDGRKTAYEFAANLAEAGVCVLSGLARGIDTQAHLGCLSANGRTVAVMGCGHETVYPPENKGLYERIIANGGSVITEYAYREEPLAWHFPQRNRILAGMSEGVLLVEGRKNSGAMITADMALDQGRMLFAVPGGIYAPLSAAPNGLLMDGAQMALSHWDILEVMNWGQRPSVNVKPKREPELSEEEKPLFELLTVEALSFDEIAYRTGLTSAKLNSLLTMLTLRGIIIKAPGGYYRAYSPN